MFVIGWSVMGNPIEKCSMCDSHIYTIGSINPWPREITKEQAQELIFHYTSDRPTGGIEENT